MMDSGLAPEVLPPLGKVAMLAIRLAQKSPARFLVEAERIARELEAALAAAPAE